MARTSPIDKAKLRPKPADRDTTLDWKNIAPMSPLQIGKNLWGGMNPKFKSPKARKPANGKTP